MPACVPSRTQPPARTPRLRRRGTPPSGGGPKRRRFTVPGADLSASITVFLLAVPMSLGLAVAIDAPLEAGLIAAGVGGIVAGLLGGSPLLVSGPSAGLTVVSAELIQTYGWRTTCAITVCAGLLQVALGSLKTARSALAVSPAIVHGTLAAIGAAIALAQLHIVLGGSPQTSAVDNALALPGQLARVGPAAPLIGALTIAVLLLWPRIPGRTGRVLRGVPAALACVVIATGAAALAAPHIARVELPSWDAHVLPELPHGPLLGLATAVLTVTLVASLESLLSAVAVDKLAAERPGSEHPPRADLDRELRGQGIANAVSGLLGGMPVSGGAVRGSANVRADATGRASTVLHGVWVLLAAVLLVSALEWIPLAALAALVMMVGIQMVNFAHIRNVHKNREFLVYVATVAGVLVFGVLQGVVIGIAVAVVVALHRLARTRITAQEEADGRYLLRVRGQLTFLAVPRLTRALAQMPQGAEVVVELDGSFMDHAAFEALQGWQDAHTARGGLMRITGRAGAAGAPAKPRAQGEAAEPVAAHSCCRPWTPWRNHHCQEQPPRSALGHQLASGLSSFQRNTAPLVRAELARLAREGQRPHQLFITCADSRLVTSMITSSGPGDLFTVRNVGNLVPPPGAEGADDSVAAAIEYAVEVLQVESITVCGHSGCGAMQALLNSSPGAPMTPLRRWLRHGMPSLERMASRRHSWARIAGRLPADAVEQLCLTNVVQQLEHLRRHESVARALAQDSLALHGMYFHVGEAQAYLLVPDDAAEVFEGVDGTALEESPA
ncbi:MULTISPECIES: bifunctional SulP family inorganic anion transporter/carbonic anhydrase [unclassified Streptomyces]|uniref:bifunctional SulP family inorganic anion transporter/carbonic anhydrase n=1 Tax=unclassified Streptomyces TaxID=2593676 RepID=UPI0037F94909